MKFQRSAQHSAVFLTELILSILIFAVVGTVCVQILVKAHLLTERRDALDRGLPELTAALELVSVSDSIDDAVQRFSEAWPEGMPAAGEDGKMTEGVTGTEGAPPQQNPAVYRVLYDRDLTPVSFDDLASSDADASAYEMSIRLSMRNGLLTAKAVMTDTDGNEIYALSVSHYVQGGAR